MSLRVGKAKLEKKSDSDLTNSSQKDRVASMERVRS
jgi:hypothetical protein